MKKSAAVGIGLIVIAAIAGAIYWGMRGSPSKHNAPPARHAQRPPPSQKSARSGPGPARVKKPKQRPKTAAARSPAAAYCAAGHDKTKTQKLAKAGGLVQIFQHQAALPNAYGCAQAYLNHGGDIDATDPRAGSKHLTPLLFAIKRNDPKMVHFMLDHGASLKKRGGPNHIKPYGYAVFEALHHQSTNYNTVINILNSALDEGSTR